MATAKVHKMNKEIIGTLANALDGWKESVDMINIMLPHITGDQLMKMGEDLVVKHKANEKKANA